MGERPHVRAAVAEVEVARDERRLGGLSDSDLPRGALRAPPRP